MRIIKQLHGLDGKLSRSNTNILVTLLHTPSPQLWHSAKNMIIGNRPIMTLGKAVKCVSPATHQDRNMPDPFTLYRALRFCLDKQKTFKNSINICDFEP